MEEILQRQMKPFLDHTRQMLLDSIAVVMRTHADSLLARLKGVSLDLVEELLRLRIEPFLGRGKQIVLDGLENAEFVQKYVDSLVAGLKKMTLETVLEVVQVQIPGYWHRFGMRVVDYALAGTLSCLAAIFLFMGGILGLERAGLPAYATYLLGGGSRASRLSSSSNGGIGRVENRSSAPLEAKSRRARRRADGEVQMQNAKCKMQNAK